MGESGNTWDDLVITDSNGEEIPFSDLDSLSVSWNRDDGEDSTAVIDAQNDIEINVTVKPPTQTVVCPHCNTSNQLLEGPFLGALSDTPEPCVLCGYPLL